MVFFLFLTLLLLVQAKGAPWQEKHALTADQYQSTFNDLVSRGYRLTYVSGYTIDNAPAFAAVWKQKSSPAWVAHHGMTASQYEDKFKQYVAQGYRLVLVNGYTVNGVDNYVAIWDKSASGAWVAKHGLSSSDYQSAINTYTSQGYRLTHVSGYAVGKDARYAAVWERTKDGGAWVARHGMTGDGYQSQFNTLTRQGYRLAHVCGYQVSGVDYYAAIWDRSSSPVWVAEHGMTSAEYQREFDNNYYQGYVLKVISGYNQGTRDSYAAIWENEAFSSADLNTIDTGIAQYMSRNQVPGLSLAITKDDRLVFAKGYGLANKETGVKVTPNSMFRIMSISKSITATTIMKLIQDGHIKLTDTVFGPGSILGDKYGTKFVNGVKRYHPGVTEITIQNLLEHESGWGANSDHKPSLITKTPAEAVTDILDNVPLASRPSTNFSYSNIGYLVLGRVITDVTGQEYETYVQNTILSQSQITRMQLADDAGPIADEVEYYPLGASAPFRIHEFDSFGGWLSTPIDMCRFNVRVDQVATKGDILSPTSIGTMFMASRRNNQYAKGWIVNMPWRGHNGGFNGTGSYLVQRTDGMGFAVVMNTNVGSDTSSNALRQTIDGAISNVVAWPSHDLF